jgi:hypothetical protein
LEVGYFPFPSGEGFFNNVNTMPKRKRTSEKFDYSHFGKEGSYPANSMKGLTLRDKGEPPRGVPRNDKSEDSK